MVCSLQEREKSLVLQILEFSNLKEQENSISQLKNQLKVKNEETKLYTLKMGSLLSENHSLRVQLSENSRTVAQVEEEREQVRVLTNKVQVLREEMEQMCNGGEERLKRMKELEEELKDLRLVNARLEEEKLELIRELELQKVKLRMDTTFHTSKEVEGTRSLVSELAAIAAQEKAMLQEYRYLLSMAAQLQVQESSLTTQLIQLRS